MNRIIRNIFKLKMKYSTKVEMKSPPIVTKSSLLRKKTRLTAVDLPKRDSKLESTYPTTSALLRYCPGSPHRLMQIADFVRGSSARQALMDLKKTNRRQVPYVERLITSAMKNGENNHSLNADRMVIKEIYVTKGPHQKRLRFHAKMKRGIQTKKYSHIKVILMEVPERENERKLGNKGWTNKTWEKYFEKQKSQ